MCCYTSGVGSHTYMHVYTEPAYVHVCIYMQPVQCVYCVECGIRSHASMKGEGVEWEVGLYDRKNSSAYPARITCMHEG